MFLQCYASKLFLNYWSKKLCRSSKLLQFCSFTWTKNNLPTKIYGKCTISGKCIAVSSCFDRLAKVLNYVPNFVHWITVVITRDYKTPFHCHIFSHTLSGAINANIVPAWAVSPLSMCAGWNKCAVPKMPVESWAIW